MHLVHGVGLTAAPMKLGVRETRDTIVDPPAALRYRYFSEDDTSSVVLSALGGLLVVQEVGTAVTRDEALSFYNDAAIFDSWYAQAIELAAGIIENHIEDFSFSFVWHAADGPTEVEWYYVRLPRGERPLVLEATLIWCLADVVDAAIRELPIARAAGEVDQIFVSQALDLFAIGEPRQVWTSQHEIELIERFYDAWKLGDRIAESRGRFDQAATAFSFFWEAGERRRDMTLTVAVSVIAVVGLLQADQQLHRLTKLDVITVDWIVVSVAIGLILIVAWRTVVMPRRAGVAWLTKR